jgi:hypothetical protein
MCQNKRKSRLFWISARDCLILKVTFMGDYAKAAALLGLDVCGGRFWLLRAKTLLYGLTGQKTRKRGIWRVSSQKKLDYRAIIQYNG